MRDHPLGGAGLARVWRNSPYQSQCWATCGCARNRRFNMVTRKTPAVRIASSAAFLVLALALVPAALAGKPGGNTSGSSSLTGPVMVIDNNGNGLVNRLD